MTAVIIGILGFALVMASIVAQVYGVVLSFRKKWYVGLAALAVPAFALVVGGAKLLGKDLLK